MRDLVAGPRRFVELQRVLPGISTEQLRSRLNRMVADGLLTRKRYREVPPRVDYELTQRARELLPVLGELARWGYEWGWGPPREGEAVDVTAIFRLAPGLIAPGALRPGTVALVVEDEDAGENRRTYSLTLTAQQVTVAERQARHVDACLRGEQAGWVAALAPSGDRRQLSITGDTALAAGVLDLLALGSEQRSQARGTAAA